MNGILCANWKAEIKGAPHTGATSVIVPATQLTPRVVKGTASWACTLTESSIPRAQIEVDCCPGMEEVLPRMHELWLTREGDNIPSFVGPILSVLSSQRRMVISAAGRSWWWWNRSHTLTLVGGDPTNVAVNLYEIADAQGTIGLTLDTRLTGVSKTVEEPSTKIGDVLDDLAVRWSERGLVLQIGPQPYARDSTILTNDSFTEDIAVVLNGEDFHTTITGSDGTYRQRRTIWGESYTDEARSNIDTIKMENASMWSSGRGPAIQVSSSDFGGDTLSNSLRQGVTIDWDMLRAGAHILGAFTTCGMQAGTTNQPMVFNIQNLRVDFTGAMAENKVGLQLTQTGREL